MNGKHEGPGAANAGALQIAAAQAAHSPAAILPRPRDHQEGAGRSDARPASAEHAIEYVTASADVFRSNEGGVYVAFHDSPGRPVRHTAGSRSPAVGKIAQRLYVLTGKYMAAEARATVADWLSDRAEENRPRPVQLRSAWDGHRLVVDVGDDSNRVLTIDGQAWHYRPNPEPGTELRRSSVTAALPDPATHGDLDALWRLVPVNPLDRPLVLALLLCAWMQGIAQPVVFFTGPQDAAKTTTARFLLRFVDPVTNQRGRTLPTSLPDWKAAVEPYLVVLCDNVSGMTAAQQDMICVVATGGEGTARALYTNSDVHITTLLAPIWMTSIGLGAIRGDLASRLVRLELPAITADNRRALADLQAEQDAAAPFIMRALLDLAVDVLRELPTIDRASLRHRLTDFELVVRCVDKVLGTQGAGRLALQAGALTEDVIDGDPVAQALVAAVAKSRLGDGRITPATLLEILGAEAGPDATRSPGWPRTPRILWDHLQRVAPALEAAEGICVLRGGKSNGVRSWIVTKSGGTT